MRLQFQVLGAIAVLALGEPEAFARGGARGGGIARGGAVGGGRVGVATGPLGGVHAGGVQGGSYTGPRGTTVTGGQVGGVSRGPLGGVHAGGAQGVKVTTPGGRTATHVSGGQATVGPRGGVSVSGGHGTAVGGYRGSAAIGTRGGVAVGPYGGVAAGRTTTAVGHSTRYMSSAAVRSSAVAVRGGHYHGAFTTAWYGRYPTCWRPVRWRAANYWVAPAFASVALWCGVTASPVVYDYGSTVVIENNNVYVNGSEVASAPQYAEQAAGFAEAGREAKPAENDEWQPLGVFGMIQGEEKVAQNIFQLAVNKDGVLRGNYYNAVADSTTPVYGSVDKKSQRVAWSIGEKKDIIFEAGLNNLTLDQTPCLAHYGKDRTEQMILVRLEEPKEKKE